MRKYKFRQELGISTAEGQPIKELGVQIYMHAEGIKENDIMEMFTMYADNFAGLIDEESEKDVADTEQENGEHGKGRWFT